MFSVDISGSCTLDSAANFPLPTKHISPISNLPQLPVPGSFAHKLSVAWRFNFGKHCTLIEVINDMVIETSHLQAEIARTNNALWEDSIYVCYYINPLLHRLLSVSARDQPPNSSSIAEALRLGAILYLVAIRQTFGIYPTQATTQLCKLKMLFEIWDQNEVAELRFEDLNLERVKIWILSLGAIMSMSRVSRDYQRWFTAQLHVAMDELGLETYTDVERYLDGFLWIADLHGQRLRTLETSLID